MDIIKRLPVKALIQFRSVSKAWKSLIDSSHFINRYKSQQQHLFVRYVDSVELKVKYVLVIDDDTFPHHKVSLTPPALAKMFKYFPDIRGSSQGLVFLYGGHVSRPGSRIAVIWNPSIRKAIGVVVSNEPNESHFLGFWVCDSDPKIVKIKQMYSSNGLESIADIFTLSTGAWRRPFGNLPHKSIEFEDHIEVTIDGFIYWAATCNTIGGDYYNLIISFDMTSEEFTEINLPPSLAHDMSHENVWISKLKNSLAVLIVDDGDDMSFDVWTMEDGVSKSFRKLYTICTPDVVFDEVLSELSSGVTDVIDYLCQQFEEDSSLATYKPYSKQTDKLRISGSMDSSCLFPYIETLLLLDQPNSVIYEEGKHYNFKVET